MGASFWTRRAFLQGSLATGVAASPLGAWAGGKAAKPALKPKRLLILGGTGFLGPHLVEAARRRHHTVTLFNRNKSRPGLFPDLETLVGDRDGHLDALKGRDFDAVIDTSGYVPRLVQDSAALLKGHTQQYLFVSTISVYAEENHPGMDESGKLAQVKDPKAEKITPETYGGLKALSEQAAAQALPGQVTVVRPGLIVGPGDPTDRFTYWPVRVARGGEVLAPGEPADPVQLVDVRDLAEFMMKLVDERVLGTFNALGPDKTLTIQSMLEACRTAAKSNAAFTFASAEFLDGMSVAPWSDMPVWIPPKGETLGATRLSNARAVQKGLSFRPIVETARDTLAWIRTQPAERQQKLRAGIRAEREREVLAAWHQHVQTKGG